MWGKPVSFCITEIFQLKTLISANFHQFQRTTRMAAMPVLYGEVCWGCSLYPLRKTPGLRGKEATETTSAQNQQHLLNEPKAEAQTKK